MSSRYFLVLGYDHVSPATDAGRIFAIIFGLVGIPLMFITAANIGKFLSEMVTNGYIEYVRIKRYLYNRIKRIKNINSTFVIDNEEHDFLRAKLPILAYFFIILSYCSLGGLFFSNYEQGSSWTFISGLFFSFNTITTIGLGNVSVDSVPYALFIIVYCIVGLAVITMCVDLASAQLKKLFTKLHYFGRTFRGARSTVMNMGDDIKELIRLIAALKSGKSKAQVTLDDLKFFIEYDRSVARAYEPKGSKFFKYMDDEDYFWDKFGGPRQRSEQTLHVMALARNERGEYCANFSEKLDISAARSPSVISANIQQKNQAVMV
uniref:Potassium channel domain-containing protein n=1 Tax=Romanomermis culicivorax TaxID=13658 RepID=A0A915KJ83_ROMCU